ncbi:hypothetical protein DPEC_G00165270 [Dallia pectoralis]|uniref:Uncharacterized protein n=1 Tax=Dallia pectoralis TaxID=75939 RepID=A0ACC2GH28_DALPE|nr:hypothetical protein DPEC_G00165270 [Dallia pectoralis]
MLLMVEKGNLTVITRAVRAGLCRSVRCGAGWAVQRAERCGAAGRCRQSGRGLQQSASSLVSKHIVRVSRKGYTIWMYIAGIILNLLN